MMKTKQIPTKDHLRLQNYHILMLCLKLQEKLDTLNEAIELVCEDTPLKPVTLNSLRNITQYIDAMIESSHDNSNELTSYLL